MKNNGFTHMMEVRWTGVYSTTEIHTVWEPEDLISILVRNRQSIHLRCPEGSSFIVNLPYVHKLSIRRYTCFAWKGTKKELKLFLLN